VRPQDKWEAPLRLPGVTCTPACRAPLQGCTSSSCLGWVASALAPLPAGRGGACTMRCHGPSCRSFSFPVALSTPDLSWNKLRGDCATLASWLLQELGGNPPTKHSSAQVKMSSVLFCAVRHLAWRRWQSLHRPDLTFKCTSSLRALPFPVQCATSLEEVVAADRPVPGGHPAAVLPGPTREHEAVQQALGDLFALAEQSRQTPPTRCAGTLRHRLRCTSEPHPPVSFLF